MPSKISWTDETWPVVTGCSRVSEGCRRCYAERLTATRLKKHPFYEGLATMKHGEPRWTNRVRLNHEIMDMPLRWKRPRRIFVCFSSDLFHEDVPFEFIDKIFAVMALTPRHSYQVLTKRPERMREYMKGLESRHTPDGNFQLSPRTVLCETAMQNKMIGHLSSAIELMSTNWPLPNIWLGVSVEDRDNLWRLDALRDILAAVKFVSYEPALGPINFEPWADMIQWLITGGESQKGARPMHPDWARAARDFCIKNNIPFHFKQWGNWWPFKGNHGYFPIRIDLILKKKWIVLNADGTHRLRDFRRNLDATSGHPVFMAEIGNSKSGHILDGKEYQEFPNH